ncbi:hypothetical protein B0H16DRAFT_1488252 [Mycena metata]|uniref:Uncharacterized protein n=1 Tax=Mycena metata TaxID=1033252 RepID=A0AAD7P2T6_9AGAR|nr:hypothetical protein B0H16DRAFT_1488252 [Mycena metata]
MPAEASSSVQSKPTTRSSIRHSLNLAGKALVEVMKQDSDKTAKKGAKDTGSRRLSAVNAKPAAPRASMGDGNRPSSIASRRTVTPDSKTITRRRASASVTLKLSLDEQQQPAKPAEATPQGATLTRAATLRPRSGVSALPKYRPKSMLGEPAKPPSPGPTRVGVRRRHSISDDDEKEVEASPQTKQESAAEKSLRPISPLPQRAAFKVNLTSVINAASPPAIPGKAKPAPSSSSKTKTSPARPTKTVKTAASSNPTVPPPRPSSSSSSSSFTPRTPKSATAKAPGGVRKGHSNQASPLRDSPQRGHSESPLARHSRKGSHLAAPSEGNDVGNMSHISEGNSEDSETEHVELLLAPVAALGAPTPAMPRTVSSRQHPARGVPPQTPTRSQLPTRANLSYLSPLPPDSADSSPSRRPQLAGQGATAGRGSILSWEQLATESSRTLGEDEIASMLSEMPAPFRPGAISPNGHLEIPESPALSALNSPGEFGSISQVLLPDVTPSPAVHAHTARYSMRDSDVPAVDAAIVTLLRLQLVSAESIAKDRLHQLQSMEEEIHNLKQARLRDAEDLEQQVARLENELRGSLETRAQTEEDRTAHIASLEDQLRHAAALHDRAIGDVAERTRENAEAEAEAALRVQNAKTSAVWSARVAGTQWAFVRDFAESELDALKGDREVLSALLADLDELQRRIISS